MSLWNAILNNNVESTKKAENAAYNATGALEKFVGIMNKTDRQKIDELSSAYDAFKQKLGEALSPIILENVEKLTNHLNNLTNSDSLTTENLKTFFEKIEKYSKLAAGGVIAFNAAVLFARALTGDPTAWATLIGLSAMGGAYAGYKVVDKYFNPEVEKDDKLAKESYYKGVQEQIEENMKLRYNYELPEVESKGYNGAIAKEILTNGVGDINYGPRLRVEDLIDIPMVNTEQNINLNLNVDVKGLENTPNEEVFKVIAKETLYESFKNINLKSELRI